MGTRLRNLKKNTKGLDEKERLTGKLIDKLTIYYDLAIRKNSDSVEKIKKKIWATLYHKISTNENPQHQNCPVGVDSWCTWQKTKASKKLAVYMHKPPQEKIFTALKPIYKDLSNDELLTRCLRGHRITTKV